MVCDYNTGFYGEIIAFNSRSLSQYLVYATSMEQLGEISNTILVKNKNKKKSYLKQQQQQQKRWNISTWSGNK